MKLSTYCKYIKPVIGRVLAVVGLILFFWLYLIIALCVFIDDPGPVIFKQKRIGRNKNGEKAFFQIYKFRTMKTSTPDNIPTHLLENPEQYITRFGKILRRTSLDEIPQLWNIAFKHELAFIGPRAGLYNQDDLYEEREKYAANELTPGITGWAQVNGRDALEIPEKARLDGEYAEAMRKNSFSAFWMDIKCLAGTVGAIARSQRDHEELYAGHGETDDTQTGSVTDRST